MRLRQAKKNMKKEELYQQWVSAFASINAPAIRRDTCHRILAIVYVYGGSMEFIYNKKLMTDIQYAKNTCRLYGTGLPNADDVEAIKGYVRDIEDFLKTSTQDKNSDCPFSVKHPKWVCELMSERYGINKMHI